MIDARILKMFHLLSHPVRLEALKLIHDQGAATQHELIEHFSEIGYTSTWQAKVSTNMGYLVEAGLVRGTKDTESRRVRNTKLLTYRISSSLLRMILNAIDVEKLDNSSGTRMTTMFGFKMGDRVVHKRLKLKGWVRDSGNTNEQDWVMVGWYYGPGLGTRASSCKPSEIEKEAS